MIFGRPEAAIAKKLSIPFAGSQMAKDRVQPLLKTMGGHGLFACRSIDRHQWMEADGAVTDLRANCKKAWRRYHGKK
jgi:hypothetical protein